MYARPETTTTYTASAVTGSCSSSDSVTYTINSNTYASGAWSGGSAPNDAAQTAIIDDNLTVATDITACGCIVKSGRNLTIPDAKSITVHGNVVNDGIIDVANEGSFVQTDDLATLSGSGTYKVNKTTGAYVNYDYVYWSSPLDNETLGSVFAANLTNYKYTYNTANFLDIADGPYVSGNQIGNLGDVSDGFDDNGDDWVATPNNTVMDKGKGYIVLGAGSPIPFIAGALGIPQPAQSVVFDGGKFNNGVIPVNVTLDKFNHDGLSATYHLEEGHLNTNFLGNPYPSAIDIKELFKDNSSVLEGTFYFWTHDLTVDNTGGPNAYDFYNSSFATIVTDGNSIINQTASGENIDAPEFIASAQGFMANVITEGVVNFNNSMRVVGQNDSFRTSLHDKLKLNLTTDDGLYRQISVGFKEGKSDAYANGEDGPRMNSGNVTDFYSIIPNDNKRYAIQTLSAFNVDKMVPLGIIFYQAGTYNISLDQVQGVFSEGQAIYLEDLYTGIIHDFTQGVYTFTSASGMNINDRFVLRFTNSALSNEETALNQVKVYPNPSTGIFHISYFGSEKLTYTVYDLTGKKVVTGTGTLIDLSQLNSGIYTAQISNEVGVRSVKLVRE